MIKKLILCIFVLFALCTQSIAAEHSVTQVKETIVQQALKMDVDPALALSIARTESRFKHEARSSYGAVGVFQLMPSTAKYLGVNPYLLGDNIKGGLLYYKKMYNMFGTTELALAAYNAGPTAVKKHNKTIPPIGETKKFVSNIMNEYKRLQKDPDPAIIKVKSDIAVKEEVAPATKILEDVKEAVIEAVDKKSIAAKKSDTI